MGHLQVVPSLESGVVLLSILEQLRVSVGGPLAHLGAWLRAFSGESIPEWLQRGFREETYIFCMHLLGLGGIDLVVLDKVLSVELGQVPSKLLLLPHRVSGGGGVLNIFCLSQKHES